MNILPQTKPFLAGVIKDIWPRSRWQRCLVILCWLCMLVTIYSAYGGIIRPGYSILGSTAPLFVMAFPVLLYTCIAMLIVCMFVWRRGARIFFITLIIVLPSALNFAPLHFTPLLPDKEEREGGFSFMTYNVMSFFDYDGEFQPGVPNRTVQYILDKNPDILCLQETYRAAYINTLNITLGQRNLRDLRYPYQLHWHDGGIAIYAKYPLKEVVIGMDHSMPWPHYKAARVYIDNDSITIINCHLRSIGLDHSDKNLYHDITDGSISFSAIEKASNSILGKLRSSYMTRAIQAEYIRSVLDEIDGNVIVCGDFNDVPLSYATRTVKGQDMTDAYAKLGVGPNITFHDNRFYFRIDHVFYRGNFEAYSIKRDKQPSSDHYPLRVEFIKKHTDNK